MIAIEDIDNLANLARLDLSGPEKQSLLKDLESILVYVSELSTLEVEAEGVSKSQALVTNVTRVDGDNTNETGEFRTDLLAEAPNCSGQFIKVKPVLGKK